MVGRPSTSNGVRMQVEVKAVKTVECFSVSGKSRLTYQFGRRDGVDGLEGVYMRIQHNSGGGMFSDEWVTLNGVLDVLRDPGYAETITSRAFRGLYVGRSVNSQSFLMAALKNEEVIADHSTKKRAYQVFDLGAFEERIGEISRMPIPEPAEVPPEVTEVPAEPIESTTPPKKGVGKGGIRRSSN